MEKIAKTKKTLQKTTTVAEKSITSSLNFTQFDWMI